MTVGLELRPGSDTTYDVVSLGEVMLRFDPGETRVRSARSFTVSEGGGEYNVARALGRVFGHRAALVTAMADNDVGRLLEDLLLQGGVDLSHVVWRAADGVGRANRTPLYFLERGFGVRAARGTYDRAHSATAALRPDEVDWDHLFGVVGARWFHTGGILAGLSDEALATARAATGAARRHGTVVSYDINYRPSLWAAAGGPAAAARMTDQLLDEVDVLFGVRAEGFEEEVARLVENHPAIQVVATPHRLVHSASSHDWGGLAWSVSTGVVEVALDRIAILDRVGGGDGFAAGVVHGLLTGAPLERALALGVAHGALVMTTPGDTSSASLAEVEHLADGGDATAVR